MISSDTIDIKPELFTQTPEEPEVLSALLLAAWD